MDNKQIITDEGTESVAVASDTVDAPLPKAIPEDSGNPVTVAEEPPKRKRGRPRKNPETEAVTSEKASEAEEKKEEAIIREEDIVKSEATEVKPSPDESSVDSAPDGEFILPIGEEIFPVFMTDDTVGEEPVEDICEAVTEEVVNEDAPLPEEDSAPTEEEEPKEIISKKTSPARVRKERPEREVGSRGIDTLFDFLELFIFTFVGVLLVTTFIFRHSVVSGDSMKNTLHDSDKLIISDLFYTPDYGDIVVVEDHTAGITSPIVKRVIALEGDTVRVTHTGIFVNGEPEPSGDYVFTDGVEYYYDLSDHIYFKDYEEYAFLPGVYYEFKVPKDEIYVLGDHRNDSTDSRRRGTVREDSVLGRVIVRFYPFSDFKFVG